MIVDSERREKTDHGKRSRRRTRNYQMVIRKERHSDEIPYRTIIQHCFCQSSDSLTSISIDKRIEGEMPSNEKIKVGDSSIDSVHWILRRILHPCPCFHTSFKFRYDSRTRGILIRTTEERIGSRTTVIEHLHPSWVYFSSGDLLNSAQCN